MLYKIEPRNTSESSLIQSFFLKQGFEWHGQNGNRVQNLFSKYLYFNTEDKDITYGENTDLFHRGDDNDEEYEIKLLREPQIEFLKSVQNLNKYFIGDMLLKGYYRVNDKDWLNKIRTQHIKNQ